MPSGTLYITAAIAHPLALLPQKGERRGDRELDVNL